MLSCRGRYLGYAAEWHAGRINAAAAGAGAGL